MKLGLLLHEIWSTVHSMATQTPMHERRQLLGERISELELRVHVCELELVESRAVFAKSLEGHVDVFDFRVLAWVLYLSDARLAVFEQNDGADLIRLSGVELGVETLQPAGLASSFVKRAQLGVCRRVGYFRL